MAHEREPKSQGTAEILQMVGAKLLGEIAATKPRDAYQPNGLPPIDESRHTDDVIAALQKRAMQID